MGIYNSRSRLRQRRESVLKRIERYIKYYSNNPKVTLRGMPVDEKYVKTHLRQLVEQKEILEERIRLNMGKI